MPAYEGDRNNSEHAGVSYRAPNSRAPFTYAEDVQTDNVVPGGTDNDTQAWLEYLSQQVGFEVHDVAAENSSPDTADRVVVSDESANGDPNRWMTLGNLATFLKGLNPFHLRRDVPTQAGGTLQTTDRLVISDDSTANDDNRWISLLTLSNWLRGRLSFDVHDDSGTELNALGAADRLPISDESTSGHPMHYTTLGGLTDYFRDTVAAWEGPWSGIASGRAIRTGTIVTHSNFVYICQVAHNKGGTGPDADTANWVLLNNWGGDWTDRYYHVGTLVEHASSTWVSNDAVNQGDPAPGASGNVKWTLVSGASRSLGQSLQRLQELLVDLHLGNEGHPINYATSTTANAGVGLGSANFTLQTARAFTNYAYTQTAGSSAQYPIVVLPHEEDQRLDRLRVTESNGTVSYIQVSQMWNLGNGTRNGANVKLFSTYRSASIPAGATVVLERAGGVDHVGTTEFGGFLTGQLKVSTYPDVTGAAILITEAQLTALPIKVAGKLYVRTD